MPSTRTEPIACRVEPLYADALRAQAAINNQTLSLELADLIRAAVPQHAVLRPATASAGA
jgi:hypothetical protein